MSHRPPGAAQFTQYAEGEGQSVSMSPRRNVPPPSAFTVHAAELPVAEQERLRKIEAPRAKAIQELPRFECRYFKTCKWAFTSEAAKLDHEVKCLDLQKLGEEQHKKDGAEQGITRDEVKAIVAETVAGVLKALQGGKEPKATKKRGRPSGHSKAHRKAAEAVRPEPDGEVEPGEATLADPPQEPDPANGTP